MAHRPPADTGSLGRKQPGTPRHHNNNSAGDMDAVPSPLRQPWKAWFAPAKPNKEDYYSWAIQLGNDGHGSLPQPPRIVDFSKKSAKAV